MNKFRKLVEAARKATPGPWQALPVEHCTPTDDWGVYQCSPHFHEIAHIARRHHGERDKETEAANASYIALCSPATILAMNGCVEVLKSLETPHCILCGCAPHLDDCVIGKALRALEEAP